jgi:hypothetical protein
MGNGRPVFASAQVLHQELWCVKFGYSQQLLAVLVAVLMIWGIAFAKQCFATTAGTAQQQCAAACVG